MKIAIVHDWLTGMRGGERCLEVFCELFPEATLFTLLRCQGTVSETIERMEIRTSFVQHLPLAKRRYRHYLPLFPLAIEQFNFAGYDLILSSSHCVAKGAIRPRGALHISYVYTPMRYAWDLYDAYFSDDKLGPLGRFFVPRVMAHLRRWDLRALERVDRFVTISHHVADRIWRHYGKEARVIYPPVDVERWYLSDTKGDYYLVVSALVPYKRIDLAVEAFNILKRPLKIVGWGPELKRLKKLAGPTVEFLGKVSDDVLASLYAGCWALIFPGQEDFGIVPLEAQAAGKPIIAFGKGGVLETVTPLDPQETPGPAGSDAAHEPTGIFFYEQTVEALVGAVRCYEAHAHRFDAKELRDHARKFDRAVFAGKIRSFIEEQWSAFK